jgi:hypothetical protein
MAKTVIFLCLTLILFINIYSSATIDDNDYNEDGELKKEYEDPDLYTDSVDEYEYE